MSNPWDQVADKFDTYKSEVWQGAAGNVATVWPKILEFIKEHFPKPAMLRALDFGCGTGMFCKELMNLGFETAGIDVSEEMIKIGQNNLDSNIKLYTGDTQFAKSLAEKEGKFNLVTFIMVLQLIAEERIKDLTGIIEKNGYLIFANHNPTHLKVRGITDTFKLENSPTTFPVYQRTPEQYDTIFHALGFNRILGSHISESKEFLEKHNIQRPSSDPKYLLLAYEKNV